MATTLYSALNLQRIPVQGLRLENLASAPANPSPGDVYYDTTLGYPRVYLTTGVWAKAVLGSISDSDVAADAAIALSKLATNPLARANHTGTQLASTISDFDTQVRKSRLDQFAAPTASVALGGQTITGLGTPVNDADAATKAYADSVAQGLDVKASVRAATTASITLSGTQTVDGVALVAGDRVLVKNQADATTNGIYVVATGAWTRATDADAGAKVSSGLFTFVETGATNSDSGFVLTTDGTITLGTTPLSFTQFSGAGAGVSVSSPLTKFGNLISLTTVPIEYGGTGGITAGTARTSLGVAQKGFAADVPALVAGTGAAIAHGLGTADCTITVRDKTSGQVVQIDTVIDATNVTLTSAVAVAASALRVVVTPAA